MTQQPKPGFARRWLVGCAILLVPLTGYLCWLIMQEYLWQTGGYADAYAEYRSLVEQQARAREDMKQWHSQVAYKNCLISLSPDHPNREGTCMFAAENAATRYGLDDDWSEPEPPTSRYRQSIEAIKPVVLGIMALAALALLIQWFVAPFFRRLWQGGSRDQG